MHSAGGLKVRPTSSRAREAIFDIIGSCEGLEVLDLFAGSGALGLEALSRGADSAVFVDSSSSAIRMIRQNVSLCGMDQHSTILQGEAGRIVRKLATAGRRFSLIFLDPPYEKGLVVKTLSLIADSGIISAESTVVAEHRTTEAIPENIKNLRCADRRRYGDTAITFWEQCSSLSSETYASL